MCDDDDNDDDGKTFKIRAAAADLEWHQLPSESDQPVGQGKKRTIKLLGL